MGTVAAKNDTKREAKRTVLGGLRPGSRLVTDLQLLEALNGLPHEHAYGCGLCGEVVGTCPGRSSIAAIIAGNARSSVHSGLKPKIV